ncbi:T9SS type A sorting domain-containing protein [Flavobacterium sp. SM2513]|uniref:T9SS type A sorting domain-containing protein n=1 Tax=Flavobacterium sp. SM2513 TaxID=3424766 RepID=UPI003D7FBDEB
MKKITLSLFTLLFTSVFFGQTYSTGTLVLNSNNGTNLNYSAKIDVTSALITLTLIGPSTGWLGIGFDNTTMGDSGDVVIFDGTNLTDRTFNGFSAPTLDAQQDWTVTSNTVSGGVRTVVGTRARDTGDANDYVFSASAQSLNIIYARKVADFTISYHGSNSCGSILANVTLGNDNFKIEDFKLYPNPSKGFTNIELPVNIESGVVKLYDALGRVVKNQAISRNDNQINTSELTAGTYILVLRTEYGNATKTLLIN